MALENGGILQAPGYSLGGQGLAVAGGPPVRILQLDADVEQNPQTVVLSINAVTQAPWGLVSDNRLQALLRWGSKSGGCEALFDVRNGCRVTLDASHITLSVQLVSAGIPATGSVKCIASVAYGSGSSGLPLTSTLAPQFLPAATNTAMIAVPNYAASARIFPNVLPVPGVTTGRVEFYSNDNAFVALVLQVADIFDTAPIPLVNGAQFFRIFNTGVTAYTAIPFFELIL